MKVVVASPLMICAQGLVSKRRKIEFRCATALGSMRAICVTRFRELVRLRFRKRSQDSFERDYVRVIRGIPPVCAAWVKLTIPPSVSCRNAPRVHDEWEFLTKSDDSSQLSAQEQKVIDYLVKDWGDDYSVTTVDIAIKAVKVDQSDESRFRIGSYIKAHPEPT